ncbi:HNH endonuclease domain-containing protein [Nostoc sp. C052]|uniref:HNH endonuclease domain-containing protein n=1 Tax=Nostoc sp. C052 TaxID=2576902 RepID=UPI0021187ACE|nr:HNH endonuclease domain-containing protein [Nostoc sp. C052]
MFLTPVMSSGSKIISTILKHDTKATSYKIALLRAINDVVLSFPDLRNRKADVAVPLRLLAQFWVAYYWPFVKPSEPILQGQRATLNGQLRNDMSFRPQLEKLRREWESIVGGTSSPSDGFFLMNELRVPRKYLAYSKALRQVYQAALTAISKAIEMPVRYAGFGEWEVFNKPKKYAELSTQVVAIPGTQLADKCLVIQADLWQTFGEMSLWIEALCIHEWCLFTEKVQQENHTKVHRGFIYQLLTDRPDNRRPLNWERNHVDVLLMEGTEFVCPWTQKHISYGIRYDLDHLLPVSLYPINELWNLVPADPNFNSHIKRDRLPSQAKLQQAQPSLELAYRNYSKSGSLSLALKEDVAVRFSTVFGDTASFPGVLSTAVVDLINIFAESRNLARF